jgi:2-oxoglutarate dehydrogenase E2 component (dihydrolipoamide succinyltransferase)
MEDRAKPAVTGGFEARPSAYVTLTIDHRVLDGFQANAFLTKWVETIEGWA